MEGKLTKAVRELSGRQEPREYIIVWRREENEFIDVKPPTVTADEVRIGATTVSLWLEGVMVVCLNVDEIKLVGVYDPKYGPKVENKPNACIVCGKECKDFVPLPMPYYSKDFVEHRPVCKHPGSLTCRTCRWPGCPVCGTTEEYT